MEEKKETFTYTYSASQQEEIQAIRRKYMAEPQTAQVDKMEQLRQLDAGVTRKGARVAISVGVFFALVMGFGMSLIMTDFGDMLNIANCLMWGICIGVVGMAGVIAAYPLYQWITRKERARIAPQILKLAEELTKQ